MSTTIDAFKQKICNVTALHISNVAAGIPLLQMTQFFQKLRYVSLTWDWRCAAQFIILLYFQDKIVPVDKRINMMLTFQANSRAREARDYRLLLDNNSWIQYWSIGQCMALVATSIGQVGATAYIFSYVIYFYFFIFFRNFIFRDFMYPRHPAIDS